MNLSSSGQTGEKSRRHLRLLRGSAAGDSSTARRCERRVLPLAATAPAATARIFAHGAGPASGEAGRLVLYAMLFLLILGAMGVGKWRRMTAEVHSELVGVEAQ
jgi:hypothetical protein